MMAGTKPLDTKDFADLLLISLYSYLHLTRIFADMFDVHQFSYNFSLYLLIYLFTKIFCGDNSH